MREKTKGYLCLAFICLVWGTTYLFIKIGVKSFPVFIFAGVRSTFAGIILLVLLSFTKVKFQWSWHNLIPNFISGALIMGIGNSFVTWSVRFIPSGLASLICTLIPVFIVILSLFISKEKKLNVMIVSGVVLGIFGMLLVFRDNIKDMANSNYIMGMLIVFLGSVSWAIGTVFSKAKTSETNAFYNAAIQLASGGICCLIYSFFTKEWSSIGEITYSSVLVLLYVTLIGSTAAYAAYQYALTTLPVGVVATYAYINPLIAVILGNLILKERLTWITGSAFILTITGVYLVNKGYNIKRPQNLLNLHH